MISGRSRRRSVFWTKWINHQHRRCSLENSEQHEENKTEPHSVGKWGHQRLSVGGGRKKTNTLSRRPDMQSLSLCSLQKNGWSKDLYVGESLTRSIMTCLFSVLPLEYLAILFFYLKRKNKRKSNLIIVRWLAESSYSSPRLIIWAVIVLFDIICICQDLQLLNMAIIFNHLRNIYLSQLTLAITWRTFLTQSLDAQKAISTTQCMSNLIFE